MYSCKPGSCAPKLGSSIPVRFVCLGLVRPDYPGMRSPCDADKDSLVMPGQTESADIFITRSGAAVVAY